jgi:two-component system, chemotaxis family, protein-glutamate methylesterase/glutaminase
MPAHDIIVIGASLGGIEALQRLASHLPEELPAAVFVVLHTGAHPSILPKLLTRAGPLFAGHAINGASIEKGRIYVAPPDHHLVLVPGHVHVTRGPKENNARPSINTLFRTAASAYGSRVAVIILTGNLNDGTVGLWEIKRHGGITIVQDPSEAAAPSMALSAIENVEIDHIVGVDEMARLLWLIATDTMEVTMGTRSDTASSAENFSGLTCPDCRGPLWLQEHGKIKEFRCRVGHMYSFESLLEQHAATTERALWTAVLAAEEPSLLAQQAAEHTTDVAMRKIYESNFRTHKQYAAVIRELLTQPNLLFSSSVDEEILPNKHEGRA